MLMRICYKILSTLSLFLLIYHFLNQIHNTKHMGFNYELMFPDSHLSITIQDLTICYTLQCHFDNLKIAYYIFLEKGSFKNDVHGIFRCAN